MTFKALVLTLFPDLFPGPLAASITGRALEQGLWQLTTKNIRDHAIGAYQAVDDTPFGAGAGMVMRADVVGAAIEATANHPGPLWYVSPRGQPLQQSDLQQLATGEGVRILCGRYEGVDQRLIEHFGMREVSIGDYVLTGGELAAMVILDGCVRLLPKVAGNPQSIVDESFTSMLLEYPQYTRPREWCGHAVPSVLLSGDHAAIAEWRHQQSVTLTQQRRPDLWHKWLALRDKMVNLLPQKSHQKKEK